LQSHLPDLGCHRREEDAREKERETAQQEAAASARARRISQMSAPPQVLGDVKPLLAHPVRAPSISDDGSESSVRYGTRSAAGWVSAG
jgi:hypothetical protein